MTSTNPKVTNYKDLIVWNKSIDLVADVYKLTKYYPRDERFGIIQKMRRASVSIPSNIAEGQGRRTTGDFIHFISNAEGSLAELDTQFTISLRLDFIDEESFEDVSGNMESIRGMLSSLRRKLEQRRITTNTRDGLH